MMFETFDRLDGISRQQVEKYRKTIMSIQKDTIVAEVIRQRDLEMESARNKRTKVLRFSQAVVLCKRCRSEICKLRDIRKVDCHFVIGLNVLDLMQQKEIENENDKNKEIQTPTEARIEKKFS